MPQAPVNNLSIEYETLGNPTHPAMLLIMGLGSQLTIWPQEFCESLARAGFHVIRFDNRDIGLSTKMDAAGKPNLLKAGALNTLGLKTNASYTLNDMATDAIGLLDYLGIQKAHIVGLSMGGMIGQILAAQHSQRVLSFTCIMSSSGNPRLPGPHWRVKLRMIKRPENHDRETLVKFGMQTWRIIGSPDFPAKESELRKMVETAMNRSIYPRGYARHMMAVFASGSRVALLKKIRIPTLIIHGQSDPLIPVAAAHELHKHISQSKLEIIPGMGHDLPSPLLGKFTAWITEHAHNSVRRAA